MQLMRKSLHIVGDFSVSLSEFLHTALNLGRVFSKLLEFQRQHRQSLVDVVVKFSPNSGALLLLCFDQLPAHTEKFLLHLFTVGYVLRENQNSSHGTIGFSPRTNFPSSPTSDAC